tara:strand:+ start:1312 stop:2031 length:720 start_codon:yes stop_codon:yes gene_type:complete
MKLLPAIDIYKGKCVRLEKGEFQKSVIYNSCPFDQAKKFVSHGFNSLHIIDLDGAKKGTLVNLNILKKIMTIPNLSVQFGGGIRDIEIMHKLFSIGMDKLIVGTAIFKKDFLIKVCENFEPDNIILALDFKLLNDQPMIMKNGWQQDSKVNLFEFIENINYFDNLLITDISVDGMLSGPNLKIYRELIGCFPNKYIIASGGIANLDDLKELSKINVKSTVIGKAIYENKISLSELKNVS